MPYVPPVAEVIGCGLIEAGDDVVAGTIDPHVRDRRAAADSVTRLGLRRRIPDVGPRMSESGAGVRLGEQGSTITQLKRTETTMIPRPSNTHRFIRAMGALTITLLAGEAAYADSVFLVDTAVDDATATACLIEVPDDCSLRGAITAGNAVPPPEPVTITVPLGVYDLTINGAGEDDNQTGDLDVLRSLTIDGVPYTRILGGESGGLDDRLLEVHGASTVLVVEDVIFSDSVPPADLHAVTVGPGATIRLSRVAILRSGSTADGGGGLFVGEGASASLDECRISWNDGIDGAGLLAQDSSVVIIDSEIRKNYGIGHGGGLAILDDAVGPIDVVTVNNSYIDDNFSSEGGGIWAGTGTELRLTDDLFEDNTATLGVGRGGAVFSHGVVVLDGTTITAGEADVGGAIYIADAGDGKSQLDMVNSTVSATSADPGDSAIRLIATDAEFLHVTMAGNGRDVFATSGSMLKVTGSLFEAGCLLILGAEAQSGGTNLGLDSSCWDGLPSAGDLVVADLMLEPLSSIGGPTPTHLPEAGSPAVDHVPGPCLPYDQRRAERPDTDCDSGSVERDPVPFFADGFESGDTGAWSTTVAF